MATLNTILRQMKTRKPAVAGARRLVGGVVWLALMLTALLSQAVYAQTTLNLPVMVADFNHDGIPDVLVPADSTPTATIAFGSVPYGTFSSATKGVTFPSACGGFFPDLSIGQLSVGDFNNDGFPDLFFFCGAGATGVMLGKGDGTFGSPVLLSGATTINGALAGDFDQDGKLDIALIGSPDNGQTTGILFYSGKGDGSFLAPVYSTFGSTATFSPSQSYQGAVTADINADGYPDIVINAVLSETTRVLSVFGNNKDGTFGSQAQATRLPSTSAVLGTAAAVSAFTIQTANIYGSGFPDVLLSSSGTTPGALVLKNTSTATNYSFASPTTLTYTGYRGALAGSFTGSAFSDLAVWNGTNITVYANDGSGNFAPAYTTLSIASTNGLYAGADANFDGYTDIYLASSASGSTQLQVDLVNGTASATSQPFSLGLGSTSVAANWAGNVLFNGTTANGSQTVVGVPSMTALTSSKNPSNVGDSVTFTAVVGPVTASSAIPTGMVTFTDGTNMIGSGTLDDTGTVSVTTSALTVATHLIEASYAGDGVYASSLAPMLSQVVNRPAQVVPTLTWTAPSPITYGTPLSGTQLDASAANATGGVVNGVFVYSPATGTVLNAGTQTLSVTFTPTDLTTYAVAMQTVMLTVLPASPATTLSLTSNGQATTQVASGTVVTLTAAVTAGTVPVTTGMVKFCDAAAIYCTDIHQLGTAQLTNAGTAVLRLIPGGGSHSYRAVFVGTRNDAGSASATSTLTVTSSLPTTTTISQAGSVGNYSLTATVTAAPAAASPTGAVSFLNTSNGNAPLGSATLGTPTVAVSLKTSSTPSSGIEPESTATGDFNGDGIPDIVTLNPSEFHGVTGTGTLTVLLGKGDGTFTAGTSPSVPGATSSLAVGDFNGDGKADVAVLTDSGTVVILLGVGDGTFTTASSSPTVGGYGDYVLVGDFNGDGNADLAVASSGGTNQISLTILLGNGDGSFAAGLPVSNPTEATLQGTGDFNGDGKADLVLVGQNSASILLGNGDGTFAVSASLPVTEAGFGGAAVADFNGDGKQDIVLSSGTTSGDLQLKLFTGNGDGTFTAGPTSDTSDTTYSYSFEVGDFNGDGKPDLAVADNSFTRILLNNGDGTFSSAASASVENTGGPDYLTSVVADFNGDGVPDVASANSDLNTVTVVLTQRVTTSTATATGLSPVGGGVQQVVASYPGDGVFAASVSAATGLTGVQSTPVVSWATPATIGYGTALSGAQLDATFTGAGGIVLSGTATYTPAAGTVLTPGTQTLMVSFAPTDSVDYTTATGSVQLVVTGPTLRSISPAAVPLGSGATTLTLTGTGFVTNSVVLVGTTAVATTYVGPTMLTAVVPAANFAKTGTLAISVSDPSITAVTGAVTLTVIPANPAVTLSGPSVTAPGSQPAVSLTITNPYPLDLTAVFSLGFAAASNPPVDDPAIQFAAGGRTLTVVVPANSTVVPPIQLQAGTDAGTITIPLVLTAGGVNVTPAGLAPVVIVVPATVPNISTTTVTRNAGTLSVAIHGFSNTREVTQATFHFVAAPGATISTPDITAPVGTAFAGWFGSTGSPAFGSTFTYTQVFNISDDAKNIGSVQVTLTNSVGTSALQAAQ